MKVKFSTAEVQEGLVPDRWQELDILPEVGDAVCVESTEWPVLRVSKVVWLVPAVSDAHVMVYLYAAARDYPPAPVRGLRRWLR